MRLPWQHDSTLSEWDLTQITHNPCNHVNNLRLVWEWPQTMAEYKLTKALLCSWFWDSPHRRSTNNVRVRSPSLKLFKENALVKMPALSCSVMEYENTVCALYNVCLLFHKNSSTYICSYVVTTIPKSGMHCCCHMPSSCCMFNLVSGIQWGCLYNMYTSGSQYRGWSPLGGLSKPKTSKLSLK